MPPKEEHLRQAAHNREFYDAISPSQFTDWSVTALFYAALHNIDAYLAENDYHPRTHEKRFMLVNTLHNLRVIADEYMVLRDESEAARYDITHFTRDEVQTLEVMYERIRIHITRLLSVRKEP